MIFLKNAWEILKKVWTVFVAIGFFYFVFFKLFPYLQTKSDHDRGCEIYHNIYTQSGKYKVEKKFIDYDNHARRRVDYSVNDIGEGTMIFDDALNLMYYNLQPGDSVIKKKNSMYYDLKSKTTNKDSMYEYYISCKDTINAKRLTPEDKN